MNRLWPHGGDIQECHRRNREDAARAWMIAGVFVFVVIAMVALVAR